MTASENTAVRIDAIHSECVGAGQCVLAAPAVFEQDEDGVVVVLDEVPGREQLQAVGDAADLCPSGALRLLGGRRQD
ncbi:ferredoxin [Streptomyces luteireticuli]|uniref:ferredoxin n=1 Tax=Streptomyces luteireticuli TaxID=173858 RepID=UPI003556F953